MNRYPVSTLLKFISVVVAAETPLSSFCPRQHALGAVLLRQPLCIHVVEILAVGCKK